MTTQRLLQEEIRQIAIDIRANRIFTSFQAPPELWSAIWLPIVFMTPDLMQEMLENNVSMLYEYMREANEYGVNGYPTFFSMRTMVGEDVLILFDYIDLLAKVEESIQ